MQVATSGDTRWLRVSNETVRAGQSAAMRSLSYRVEGFHEQNEQVTAGRLRPAGGPPGCAVDRVKSSSRPAWPQARDGALTPAQGSMKMSPVGQAAVALRDAVVGDGKFQRALDDATGWLVLQAAAHNQHSAVPGAVSAVYTRLRWSIR